jgi:choline dehydrogenase
MRRGCADGIRLADGTRISAGAVVLAAGAFGSPVLLLRSGIGDPDELNRHGVPVVAPLTAVGRNLADHPRVSSEWPADPAPTARHQYQVLITSAGASGSGFDFQHFAGYAPQPSNLRGRGPVFWLCASLMKPLSRGRVSLRSAKAEEPPHIELGLLCEAADLNRLIDGLRTARRICAAPPLRKLLAGGELLDETAGSDDAALRAAVRAEVRSAYHQVGTCAMGLDPDAGSVVDARGRVHLVDRLWVCDASIMPEVPSANTNLATIMLAERISVWLDAEV